MKTKNDGFGKNPEPSFKVYLKFAVVLFQVLVCKSDILLPVVQHDIVLAFAHVISHPVCNHRSVHRRQLLCMDEKNPSSDAAPFSSVKNVNAHSTRPLSSGKSTLPLNMRGKIRGLESVFSAKKSATPFG